MILNKETWRYIVEKQKLLDNAFMVKAKWKPDGRDRKTALRIEVCEFANEFPEKLKWWKHKDNDLSKVLDEYVDILHFMAGITLDKDTISTEFAIYLPLVGLESQTLKTYKKIESRDFKDYEKYTVKWLLQELVKTKKVHTAVALATYILEREGFTDEDIRKAYDQKNAENFERIEAGY